jgi:hypothetical protein
VHKKKLRKGAANLSRNMEKEFMYNTNNTALFHAMKELTNGILISVRHAKIEKGSL